MRSFITWSSAALMMTIGAACASESAAPDIVKAPETVTMTATPQEGSTEGSISTPTCEQSEGGERGVFAQLTDVRVAKNSGFDRIVFEFETVEGPPDGVPRYQLGPAAPPFMEDGSGAPIEVAGESFTRVVFHGASGYDIEAQEPTYDGPREFEPGLDIIAAVSETGDFEATLSWIIGLEKSVCPQVSTLFAPNRLVVDFPNRP